MRAAHVMCMPLTHMTIQKQQPFGFHIHRPTCWIRAAKKERDIETTLGQLLILVSNEENYALGGPIMQAQSIGRKLGTHRFVGPLNVLAFWVMRESPHP